MTIFETIIAPFIFIIEQLFLLGFELTNNYGAAIILLSFGISLLLLPVFVFIEKAKKKDDAIKHKMQPSVDVIKRVYKGQERYYYLKTLNRQFGYNPLKALIPILSLLLQIPFFIAAYQYLESYEALKGISFWFINDLSQADGLLGAINILPIAMTVVNLITAWFYTRGGNTAERKQMLIVAAAFLILLFNLPAGLVLYWTMNNVFSFFRLFVTNPEVFKKIERVKKEKNKLDIKNVKSKIVDFTKERKRIFVLLFVAFYLSFLFAFKFILSLKTISLSLFLNISFISIFFTAIIFVATFVLNILNKNFDKHFSKLYQFLFFVFLFLLPSVFFGNAESYNNSTALICLIFLLFVKLTICVQIFNMKINKWLSLRHIMSIVVFALFFVLLFNCCVDVDGQMFRVFNISINGNIMFSFCLFLSLLFVINNRSCIRKIESLKDINTKGISIVYFLSVAYIVLLIFIVHPLIVYSSYPVEFSFYISTLILENLKILGIAAVVFVAIYLLFYTKQLKVNLTAFVSALSVLFLFNCFIFPVDVGTLQEGWFVNGNGLTNREPWVDFVEFFSFLFIFFFFRKKLLTHYKLFRNVAIILLVILIVQGTNAAIKGDAGKVMTGNHKFQIAENQTSNIPLSKTEKNVIVFVSDMFLGHYIFDLIDSIPELENKLDGFTYYPNTLSISSITCSSFPAMFAGVKHNIHELNKDTEHTMSQKFGKTFNLFKDKIKSKGYNLVSNDIIYSSIKPKDFDLYLPNWDSQWEKYYNRNYDESRSLYLDVLWQNALFYSAPNMFKRYVYNNGSWLTWSGFERDNNVSFKGLAFVNILPKISKVVESKGNFMFIHNKVTHFPWGVLDENDNVHITGALENHKWFIEQFINWIGWMKEAGVYDNTKIVLLSDHSSEVPNEQLENFGGKRKWTGTDKLNALEFWRLNSLMLIKDFKSRGDMKTDWRLMTNADMSDIALNDSSIIHKPIDSLRVVPTFVTWAKAEMQHKKNIRIYYKFNVQSNMYDADNWTVFSE